MSGKFREDLFFRLQVFPIFIPPLRDRREDIPLLVKHFVERFCQENGRLPKEIHPDVMKELSKKEYRGNIRELKNLVERLMIQSEDLEITTNNLREIISETAEKEDIFVSPKSLSSAKEELERKYVLTQLELNNWDMNKVSSILGIEKTNLYRKMRQLKIPSQIKDS